MKASKVHHPATPFTAQPGVLITQYDGEYPAEGKRTLCEQGVGERKGHTGQPSARAARAREHLRKALRLAEDLRRHSRFHVDSVHVACG